MTEYRTDCAAAMLTSILGQNHNLQKVAAVNVLAGNGGVSLGANLICVIN